MSFPKIMPKIHEVPSEINIETQWLIHGMIDRKTNFLNQQNSQRNKNSSVKS